MRSIARPSLCLPLLVSLSTVALAPQVQASPVYSVVDLGLTSASPTIPASLINPQLINASGDSVATVPVYAQPDASHPEVSLTPIDFYATFTPNGGSAMRIGLTGPDFTDSGASAINNSDQAVGESSASTGVMHAFVFTNGQTFDLNNLIPSAPNFTITRAFSIDDQARILAEATSAGVEHTVMLVPEAVPEPSMLAVVALLLGAAGIQTAWRKRSDARSRACWRISSPAPGCSTQCDTALV